MPEMTDVERLILENHRAILAAMRFLLVARLHNDDRAGVQTLVTHQIQETKRMIEGEPNHGGKACQV